MHTVAGMARPGILTLCGLGWLMAAVYAAPAESPSGGSSAELQEMLDRVMRSMAKLMQQGGNDVSLRQMVFPGQRGPQAAGTGRLRPAPVPSQGRLLHPAQNRPAFLGFIDSPESPQVPTIRNRPQSQQTDDEQTESEQCKDAEQQGTCDNHGYKCPLSSRHPEGYLLCVQGTYILMFCAGGTQFIHEAQECERPQMRRLGVGRGPPIMSPVFTSESPDDIVGTYIRPIFVRGNPDGEDSIRRSPSGFFDISPHMPFPPSYGIPEMERNADGQFGDTETDDGVMGLDSLPKEYAECELGTYRPNAADTSFYEECVQSGESMYYWLRRQCPPGTRAKQFPTSELPCDFQGSAWQEPPEGAVVVSSSSRQSGGFQNGFHHETPGAVEIGEVSGSSVSENNEQSWSFYNSSQSGHNEDYGGPEKVPDDNPQTSSERPATADMYEHATLSPDVNLYVTKFDDLPDPTTMPPRTSHVIGNGTPSPTTVAPTMAPSTLPATHSVPKVTEQTTTLSPSITSPTTSTPLTESTTRTTRAPLMHYRTTPYRYPLPRFENKLIISEEDIQAVSPGPDTMTDLPSTEDENTVTSTRVDLEEQRNQFVAEAQGDLVGAKNVDFNSISMISHAEIGERPIGEQAGPFKVPFVYDMDDVMLWPGDVVAEGNKEDAGKHLPMYHLKIPIPDFYENNQ